MGVPEVLGVTRGSLGRPSDHSTLHQDIRGSTLGINKKQGAESGAGGEGHLPETNTSF